MLNRTSLLEPAGKGVPPSHHERDGGEELRRRILDGEFVVSFQLLDRSLRVFL